MFSNAESVYYAGRCLAKLVADAEYVKSHNGRIVTTSELADRYSDLKDVNGGEQSTLTFRHHVISEAHRHKMHAALQSVVDNLNKLRTSDLQ